MDTSSYQTNATIIPKIKRGRPKLILEFNRKEYNKEYYLKNKEKYIGDYHCVSCNLICSLSNKTRHRRSKIHLDNLLKN